MNELALFAGAGGGILGGHLLGWTTICAVERDAYAAQVLAQRQNDGSLPPFPIWSDVTTFDGTRWRGRVDVISGGFPCQDISVAGRGEGMSGERSGLWSEFNRIIGEVRPRFVFVENSPALTSRGLGDVLGDLAALGYNAEWGVLGASDVGAPHVRKRIWIVAYTQCAERRAELGARDGLEREWADGVSQREEGPGGVRVGCEDVANSDCSRRKGHREGPKRGEAEHSRVTIPGWWLAEPSVGRVVNGMAYRVDRLKATGNGQVPRVAATAFTELSEVKQ